MTQDKRIAGYINVTYDGKDSDEWYYIEENNKGLWWAFDNAWKATDDPPVEGQERTKTVRIPSTHAKYKTVAQPFVQKCLFAAADQYLKRMGIGGLDKDDEDFFTLHPLTEPEGVTQPDTLRVLQELVGVYGVKISRVVCATGLSPKGDLKQWRDVLGCNPLAYADNATSNAEFAKEMGLNLADVDNEFRFEFRDSRLRPAITCGTMNDTQIAPGGGHATFVGPREKGSAGLIQIQLAKSENVKWQKEPVFPVLKEKAEQHVLDMWNCLAPDGKTTMSNLSSEYWMKHNRSEANGNTTPSTYSSISCRLCVQGPSTKSPLVGGRICQSDWHKFCSNYTCVKCKHAFREGAPLYRGMSYDASEKVPSGLPNWRIDIECPKCKQALRITQSDEDPAVRIVLNGLRSTEAISHQDYMQFKTLRS